MTDRNGLLRTFCDQVIVAGCLFALLPGCSEKVPAMVDSPPYLQDGKRVILTVNDVAVQMTDSVSESIPLTVGEPIRFSIQIPYTREAIERWREESTFSPPPSVPVTLLAGVMDKDFSTILPERITITNTGSALKPFAIPGPPYKLEAPETPVTERYLYADRVDRESDDPVPDDPTVAFEAELRGTIEEPGVYWLSVSQRIGTQIGRLDSIARVRLEVADR